MNHSSMFQYNGCQYSVPPEYVGKNVFLQIYDGYIHVYYSTYFITIHMISKKKLNYHNEHYAAIVRKSHAFLVFHLDEVTDFVTSNNLPFTEGLLKLSNYEVGFKEKNASRSMIKAAAFPFVKELKDYDFDFQPGVNEQEIKELCTLGFLERSENIVFLGPSGVGKTHLATSIGIAAAKRCVSTYFIKCNT